MSESSTYLFFRDGSSDKVYNVHVAQKGSGYVVNFEHARRGASLKCGSKTADPVSLEKATKIAEKLVNKKRGEGYTDAEGGKPYEGNANTSQDMGFRVQLLNPIEDDAAAERFLNDSAWVMQEKYDGERALVIVDGDEVTRTNRKGFAVPVAIEVADVARRCLTVSGRSVLDGEMFGTTFAPFDLLMLNGVDIRDQPYVERLRLLETLTLDAVEWPRLHTYRSTEQKRRMYAQLREDNAEGVVFKRASAPSTAGRPSSGGDQIKRKFVETASCRVIDRNDSKRSVQLELLDPNSGLWTFVGNVTIPPNFAIPGKGQVVEVRYLYAMKGGSLIQSVFAGIRSDIDAAECTIAQLKFKRENDAIAA